MPIEIRELVIRATVVDDTRGASEPDGPPGVAAGRPALRTEQIVEECVEQVLAILKLKKDR